MSAETCDHCTATVTNGLALCSACQQTLRQCWVNVAAYYADVDRIQPGQRVKVRSAYQSTPPPLITGGLDRISEALDHAAVAVVGWARNLADDRPQVGELPSSIGACCGWLESYTTSIATLEWAAVCLDEMLEVERNLRRILDQADTGWYAGMCGNEVGREETDDGTVPLLCERHLYGTQGTSWVRCPECGRTWDASDRRRQLIAESRDHVAPVSIIARAVVGLMDEEASVQRLANRIDQWVKRGRLTSMGVRVLEDGKPHRVYRIGDVFDLMKVEVPATDAEAC